MENALTVIKSRHQNSKRLEKILMKTTQVAINFDAELLAKIDQFKTSRNFPSREHIIKHILKDWLHAAEWVESREPLNEN